MSSLDWTPEPYWCRHTRRSFTRALRGPREFSARSRSGGPMADGQRRDSPSAVQVEGQVFSVKPVGDYVHLTLIAGEVAERARPGMFVALGIGGETSAVLSRRPFWV